MRYSVVVSPSWVPSDWTLEVEADSEDEARDLAREDAADMWSDEIPPFNVDAIMELPDGS